MIRNAQREDLPALISLASQLWPEAEAEELAAGFEAILSDPEAALFLAFSQEVPVAFAQCQLRHDYVEGTDSSPVGYLEGIFVEEPYRRRGYAKLLLAACEVWAGECGCTEFASDCELDNVISQAWHMKNGFREMGRTVWFAKKL